MRDRATLCREWVTLFWLVLLFCSTGATNFPRGAARGRTEPNNMLVCHESPDMLFTVSVVNQMLGNG